MAGGATSARTKRTFRAVFQGEDLLESLTARNEQRNELNAQRDGVRVAKCLH